MKMGGMLNKIVELQKRMEAAQKEIAAMNFEGSAANGLLKVVVTGNGELKRVDFDNSLKGEDLETLGALVIVAVNQAQAQKEEVSKKKLSGMASGLLPMGLRIPGLG